MARRGFAMALHVHVVLCRERPILRGLSSGQRPLSRPVVYASRHSWSVADGAALFFLWTEAGGDRPVQSAAEAGLYVDDCVGRALAAYWNCPLQARAVFVAGLSVRRVSSHARVAFCGDVRIPCFYSRTPAHGCAAW